MQTLIKLVVTLGGLLLPCLVAAQAPNYAISGPSLGLVADRAAGSIRPILGIPGAAMWGAPLSVDFATVQAAVAPGGDFALVVAKENFRVASVRASDGAVQWLALEATLGAPDILAFSPRGRSAALYYQASRRLVVLSGLRDGAAQITQANAAGAAAAAGGISGKLLTLILVGAAAAAAGTAVALTRGGTPTAVVTPGTPTVGAP